MEKMYTPAIRSEVGDWGFYISTLSFGQVATYIKAPDEVHERKGLADWIQREAIEPHKEAISEYILSNQSRFLGAIIVGVYGGHPNWAPLDVNFANNILDIDRESQTQSFEKLGFLAFSGEEKLFAIDGQHRVEGIKAAIRSDNGAQVLEDEIVVIFIPHDPRTIEGRQRTRRLFTTVNKKAKQMSKTALIALDEDNGFAVVTRNVIDQHPLFKDKDGFISYTASGALHSSDDLAFTTVISLHEVVKDLFPGSSGVTLTKKQFADKRPTEQTLAEYTDYIKKFLDTLLETRELKRVFIEKKNKAVEYRAKEKNYLLFRPVGQRAFARAHQVLTKRGYSLKEATKLLHKVEQKVTEEIWHHILWDPVSETMITEKPGNAETRLLLSCGEEPRDRGSLNRFNNLLEGIS
jgi:DNA sulfur modification protein DndB